MKLIIIDHADPSVGAMPMKYIIDVPFGGVMELQDLKDFRDAQLEVYKNYAIGKVTANYDEKIEHVDIIDTIELLKEFEKELKH